MRKSTGTIPFSVRVATAYFIVGAFWILLSDKILGAVVRDPTDLIRFSVMKGWGFILVTAFMLHLLIRRWTANVERSREEARLSDAKYREIVEGVNSIILRTDHTGRLTYVNDFALRFFGYPSDELMGRNVSETIFPPAQTPHPPPESLIENPASYPDRSTGSIAENILRNGERVWIVWTNKPVFDENGRLAEILCVGNDITERKKAEQALRESEEKFSVAFRRGPVMAAITALEDGAFIDVNERFVEVSGFSREELLGMTTLDIGEGNAAERSRFIEALLMRGAVSDEEFAFRTKDGTTIYGLANSELVTIGGARRILTMALDVTERKKAIEAIREREETFRRLFEDSTDPILLLEDSRFVDCNPAAIRLFGYPKDRLLATGPFELSPPFQPDGMSSVEKGREMAATAEQIGHHKFDWVHRKADGSDFYASIMLTSIVLHGRKLLHATVRDITYRKQAEKALFEQYELQRVLLSTIPAYVYIKDKDLVYMAANKEFGALVGVAEKEISGKTDYDFFPEPVADAFRKNDLEVIWTGEPMLNYEESGKDAQGNDVWFQTSKCPFYTPSGEIAGLVGICINTTEKKRADAERLLLQKRLQQGQKAESLARMGGAIAHHFNNMLGIVIGNLELAMLDLPLDAKYQATVGEAMKASKRAVELSRLMLTCLGQDIGVPSLLNLAKVCRQSLPMLNALAPENVRIKAELTSDDIMIKADVVRLRQILGNLVLNGAEAIGDRQGDISIAVFVTPAAQIPSLPRYPFGWEPKEGDYACIAVSDTGGGMSEETFEKIFDPFFSTKFTGRGLGLAVVLGIVTAYDGAISVESSSGQGSVFKIFLPVSKEEPLLPLKNADLAPKTGGLILLVEDEPQIRMMAKRMLEHLKYEAVTADDGTRALEIFSKNPESIRCVVLDVTMPGMDGWETLAALRAIRPDLPAVIATGHRETDVVRKDHPAQPQAFLFKPYQIKDMQAAIEAAVGDGSPVPAA